MVLFILCLCIGSLRPYPQLFEHFQLNVENQGRFFHLYGTLQRYPHETDTDLRDDELAALSLVLAYAATSTLPAYLADLAASTLNAPAALLRVPTYACM